MRLPEIPEGVKIYFLQRGHIDKSHIYMLLWRQQVFDAVLRVEDQLLLDIEEHLLQELQKLLRIIMEPRPFEWEMV